MKNGSSWCCARCCMGPKLPLQVVRQKRMLFIAWSRCNEFARHRCGDGIPALVAGGNNQNLHMAGPREIAAGAWPKWPLS